MSTTVGAHSGAGPLSLMSCVRESSPLQDYEPDNEKNDDVESVSYIWCSLKGAVGVTVIWIMPRLRRSYTWSPEDAKYHRDLLQLVSKRKFWNPKKWFRKKQKTGNEDTVVHSHHQEQRDVDGSRSRSTGELSTDEEPSRSHEGRNSTSMHPGLSVSHDSVFHPLNSGSSDLELDGAQSCSSLSISQPLGDAKLQTELSSRLRLRRGRGDTSEDDEGLPRSPPCGSPAAAVDSFLILEKTVNHKDLPTKSHSTCSDGSLLSMDSSEMDEDSVLQSRHSSKISLNEKKIEQESELELGPSFSTTPLNHSAAHHRVSVRPKRTYGAPRRKKGQLSSALPATPEVNEDSSVRSISPESVTTEPITELYSSTAHHHHHHHHRATLVSREVKLKCNSLPAGATPPTSDSLFRLSRSKSNAGKSRDDDNLHKEGKEEKVSLFERLFPRRSGKKKQKKDEEKIFKAVKVVKMEVDGDTKINTTEERKTVQIHSATPTSTKLYTETKAVTTSHVHTKPLVAPRTGAASRQRIQPIDIPATPKEIRSSSSMHTVSISPISPDKSFSPGTSPIQMELEHFLRQRHATGSPKETALVNPARSPKLSTKTSVVSSSSKSSYTETRISSEDIRSKIKIAGLSPLQQRVLSHNSTSDESDSGKLMTVKLTRPLSKSHSFKNHKSSQEKPFEESMDVSEKKMSVTKATSLDSVKNLEEPEVLKSELNLTLKPSQKAAEQVAEVEEIEVVAEKSLPEIVSHSFKMDNNNKSHINTVVSEDKPKLTESTCNTHSSSIFEEHSVNSSTELAPITVPKSFSANSITISGPSHTAIVNVTSKSEDFSQGTVNSESEAVDMDGVKKVVQRESQVSVTKIQLKHETTQVTKTSVTVPKPAMPEFLNKQLNKVEARPTSNIVFSMKSPKIVTDDSSNARPKTLFNFPPADIVSNGRINQLPRKFSKEDVEIIEKPVTKENKDVSPPKTPPVVTPTTPNQNRFKKNDSRPSSRKSSVISITPESSPLKESVRDRALKARSISLDSLKSDEKADDNTSSQDSLEKRSQDGSVVLRRKSFAKQKNEEESELMKVFARRSLKLKDSEVEQIQEAIIADDQQRQRDSDKENSTAETSPESEKKIISPKEERSTPLIENITAKIVMKEVHKQPLTEIKKSPEFIRNVAVDDPEVQLRRSVNNNIFLATQRATSLNTSKTVVSEFHVKKQASLNEKRRTDQWISTKKDEEETQQEIVTKTEDVKAEIKNVSQRRAEWEKRAQQGHQ